MIGTLRLSLARHGESEANAANVFTGWANPPLTNRGRDEAQAIASRLERAGVTPRRIFTSRLDRAVESSKVVASRLSVRDTDVIMTEALNERDYGDLTGLNKTEAVARWGEAQVRVWRRSYDVAPPHGESLRDTAARVLACYIHSILPALVRDKTVLVVAHGNSLRALVMGLEGLTTKAVEDLEIRTGACLLYELAPDTSVAARAMLE